MQSVVAPGRSSRVVKKDTAGGLDFHAFDVVGNSGANIEAKVQQIEMSRMSGAKIVHFIRKCAISHQLSTLATILRMVMKAL